MSTPKPELDEADDAPESESEPSAIEESIAPLRLANDVDGLLALAKQYRSGTGGVPRDMKASLAAYLAAADLGSPIAQHAAGLFFLTGGVVERDEREAALKFRAAADQGHVPAKVIVANLYELGIHYRADAAKADVWYRNAARSAGIDLEPSDPGYARALANLGCVRYCLEIAQAKETTDEDRARLLKLAKSYGHRPLGDAGRLSELPRASMTPVPADSRLSQPSQALDAVRAAPSTSAKPAVDATNAALPSEASGLAALRETPKKPSAKLVPKANVGLGATAFVFSLVFAAVGLVLGHVLRNLGIDRIAEGGELPVVARHVEAILPMLVGLLAVLPNLLVYRRSAFLRAASVGVAGGIAAEVLWGMGHSFLETRVMQITDFSVAGLLIGLLVFGIFGGAKPGSR